MNPPACVTFPHAGSHLLSKASHLIEHGVNIGHDVMPINEDLLIWTCTQRNMQDGPAFGYVDFVATKHGLDAWLKTAFPSQTKEKSEGVIRDAIFE